MARIIYTLGELKGSIAGLTFQNNSSGHTVRQRPNVTKSSSQKQQQAHADHTYWLYRWTQIGQTKRDAWNLYASLHLKTNKFGETKQLTGLNWFESINWEYYKLYSAQLSSPPTYTIPAAVPDFNIITTPTSIAIQLLSFIDLGSNDIIIWVSLPTTRNKATINQIRKRAGKFTSTWSMPMDMTAIWEAATGLTWTPNTLFPNANIFVCLQSISKVSGITSALNCSKTNLEEMIQQPLYSNLFIETTSNSTVTGTADLITVGVLSLNNVSVQGNIAISGAGGLDTGAEAANTTYHFFLITNDTGSVQNGLLSLSATAPTLPANFTRFRRIASIRNNAASNFLQIIQEGELCMYRDFAGTNRILVGGVAIAFTTLSTAPFIPSTSRKGIFNIGASITLAAAGTNTIDTRETGSGSATGQMWMTVVSQVAGVPTTQNIQGEITLDAIQRIDYKISAAPAAGGYSIDVAGYYDRI